MDDSCFIAFVEARLLATHRNAVLTPHNAAFAFDSMPQLAPASASRAPAPTLAKKRWRSTARRRAQGRKSQARYRDRQRTYAQALQAAVAQLRDQLPELLARRQQLMGIETASQVVVTLYDVMRHGLARDEHRPTQLAFLARVFHENVRLDAECGRAAVVQQWLRFSECWGDLSLDLEQLECVVIGEDDATLQERVHLELTITKATICHVFPHVLAQHNHDLLQRLVGQRLVCDATATHRVHTCGQILQVEWSIDFVCALRSFLSLRDVGRVLEGARIERDAYLMAPRGDKWLVRQKYLR